MYHEVSPRPLPAFRDYTVTPKAFAAQVAWLARAGYEAVSLDQILEHRAGRATLPAKPVVFTFDDGFQGCVDRAVPILQEWKFTAVFFLVVAFTGATSRWMRSEVGVELPLMSWAKARRLESEGFQCGSHTLTHPRLANLPDAACQEELLQSRLALEDQLGHEVRHLAYPHGSYDERVRRVAAETGYDSACSSRIGLSAVDDDLFALHRVVVSGRDSLRDFVFRVRMGQTPRQLISGKAQQAYRRRTQRGDQSR